MFSDNKKSKSKNLKNATAREQNKIAQGTLITGNIEAKGGFRIEGKLKGNLKTPGKVVLGKTGEIEGDLECENADIEGSLNGKLTINDTLILRSSAQIKGETITEKLSVEPGANFNAQCTMHDSVKSLKNERQEKKRQEEEKTV